MRAIIPGILLAILGAGSAQADATLGFAGSILDSCALALSNNGTLAASPDGTTMGSEEGSAQPARLTILSTGSHTISVGAPTLTTSPSGYDPTGQQLQVAYKGATLLSSVNQAYTTSAGSFPVATVALSSLTVNNRVVNGKGLPAGAYATQTVVTCN
jgi:hypothetical protein